MRRYCRTACKFRLLPRPAALQIDSARRPSRRALRQQGVRPAGDRARLVAPPDTAILRMRRANMRRCTCCTAKPCLMSVRSRIGKQLPSFLADEVLPFVSSRYRVSGSASQTGIGGTSLGASAALYISLTRPDPCRDPDPLRSTPPRVFRGRARSSAPVTGSCRAPKYAFPMCFSLRLSAPAVKSPAACKSPPVSASAPRARDVLKQSPALAPPVSAPSPHRSTAPQWHSSSPRNLPA